MPTYGLPTFDFTALAQPSTLALGFLVISALALVMGLILAYHWNNYGVEAKRAWLAEILYFSGLAILIGLGIILISLFAAL